MPAILKSRAVKGIPGLKYLEIPLYTVDEINVNIVDPKFISVSEMQSTLDDIWRTGDSNDIKALNALKDSNDPPQMSQARSLQSLRARCEADLPNLDMEALRLRASILDLSQQLAEISVKRLQNQRLADVCKSCLSPIRQLPLETLGEVFFHSVALDERSSPDLLLSISQVCSLWRRAALAFPILWSTVSLTSPPPHGYGADSTLVQRMKLWFDRAKNSPLTLDLQITRVDFRRESHPIIDAVIPYMGHMQKLRLMTVKLEDIHGLLSLSPGQVNMLESVHLGFPIGRTDNHTFTVFDGAPLLRELTLENNFVDPYSTFILPWNQLTKLTICNSAIPQSKLLKVLKECSSLVSASFDAVTTVDRNNGFSDDDGSNPLEDGPYLLENLLDLNVVLVYWYGKTGHIFDNFVCPALLHFWLSGDEKTRPSSFRTITLWANLLRTAVELQTLTLTNIDARTDGLLSILRCTPQLVDLRLSINLEDNDYDGLIEALTCVPGRSNPYLPQLQSLDIKIRYHHSKFRLSGDAFVAMVRSRQNREVPRPPAAYLSSIRLRLGIPGYTPPDISIVLNAHDRGEISGIEVNYDDNPPFHDI